MIRRAQSYAVRTVPTWARLRPLALQIKRHAAVIETVAPKAPKLHISPLEIARLPLLEFPGRIIVIGSAEEEQRIESIFENEVLLGFDSESRPSSALGPQNRIALIQLASEKVACLWRLLDTRSLPPVLCKLLQDLWEVSQGAVNEITALKDQFGISPQSFIDLHHIALHLRTTPRSLRGLAAIFLQKRLDKEQRLSDWQQSSLTQAQIEYAATDAWTARELFVVLGNVRWQRGVQWNKHRPTFVGGRVPQTMSQVERQPMTVGLWDRRYSKQGFAYGTDPNDFLLELVDLMPKNGKALFLGEGEGRNSTFLAQRGLTCTAVDISKVGLSKARRLAEERGVKIKTVAADLSTFDFGVNCWDLIVSIFCHLTPTVRAQVHFAAAQALRPGGLVVVEAFSREQLKYNTGGPPDEERLVTPAMLQEDFKSLEVLHCEQKERSVVEGKYHTGLSSVVQLVARKIEENLGNVERYQMRIDQVIAQVTGGAERIPARAVTPLSEKRPFFDVPDDASAEKHRAWAEQLWCRMDRDRSGTVTREELMCDEFQEILKAEEWANVDVAAKGRVSQKQYDRWLRHSDNPVFKPYAPTEEAIEVSPKFNKKDANGLLQLTKQKRSTWRPLWNDRWNCQDSSILNKALMPRQKFVFSRVQTEPELRRFYMRHPRWDSHYERLDAAHHPRPQSLLTADLPPLLPERYVPSGNMRNPVTRQRETWNDYWQTPKSSSLAPRVSPGSLLLRCPGQPPDHLVQGKEE
eukprot:symbB.v1.2.016675.t1/scaffold1275.1/size127301/3